MIQKSLVSGGKKVIRQVDSNGMLPKNSKNRICGLKGSYSNVTMKKGGNTYMRPFVRIDTMYRFLQGDFCLIYIFTKYG